MLTNHPLLLPAQDPAEQEQATEAAGQALSDAVLVLATYRTRQLGRPDLSEWQFEHLRQLGTLFDALAEYDNQTKLLLRLHEANTNGLNNQLHAALERGEVPAWTQNPNPTPAELLAEREADPVYRLGFVRGYRKGCADTGRRYERVVSLYAQYAVLVPPPGYQPSPLVAQVQATYAYQANLPRLNYPLEVRQDLATITHHHLPNPAPNA